MAASIYCAAGIGIDADDRKQSRDEERWQPIMTTSVLTI